MSSIWSLHIDHLVFQKFLVIALIHSLLCFFMLELYVKSPQKTLLSKLISLTSNILHTTFNRVLFSIAIGSLISTTSSWVVTFSPIATLLFLNLAFLTLWYFELAILLYKGFFKTLFGNELPEELILVVSLTMMANAGYFTTLLLFSLLRASTS